MFRSGSLQGSLLTSSRIISKSPAVCAHIPSHVQLFSNTFSNPLIVRTYASNHPRISHIHGYTPSGAQLNDTIITTGYNRVGGSTNPSSELPVTPLLQSAVHPKARASRIPYRDGVEHPSPGVNTPAVGVTVYPLSRSDDGPVDETHTHRGDELDLLFLGSGCSSTTELRQVMGLTLRLNQNHHWVFDCGENTLQRVLAANIPASSIRKIFISHLHSDHVMGLPPLLVGILASERASAAPPAPIDIYGPVGLSSLVLGTLSVTNPRMLSHVCIHEIVPSGFPLEGLPVGALYNNNLPSEQKCQFPRPHHMDSHAKRVEYLFTDPTTNFSSADPADWQLQGIPQILANRNHTALRKQLARTEPLRLDFPEENMTVDVMLGDHTVTSWGWAIEEHTRRRLLMDKVDETPIVPGPHLEALRNGHTVSAMSSNAMCDLPTGERIRRTKAMLVDLANDFHVGPYVRRAGNIQFMDFGKWRPDVPLPALPEHIAPHMVVLRPEELVSTTRGRKVVLLFDCSGGLRMHRRAIDACRSADLLVHEATFYHHTNGIAAHARKKRHSTALGAAQFAKEVKPAVLVLNHFSSKYRNSQFTGLMRNSLWHRANGTTKIMQSALPAQESIPMDYPLWHMSSLGHLTEAAVELGLLQGPKPGDPIPISDDDLLEDTDCECESTVRLAELDQADPCRTAVLGRWRQLSTVNMDVNESRGKTYGLFTSHDMMMLRLPRPLTDASVAAQPSSPSMMLDDSSTPLIMI